MAIRNLLVIGLITCLSGCVTDSLDDRMNRWIGRSKDDLMVQIGAPQRTTVMSDGGELLEYSSSSTRQVFAGREPVATAPNCARSIITPAYAGAGVTAYQMQTQYSQSGCGVDFAAAANTRRVYKTVTDTCDMRFKTDQNGTIKTWSYNGC